MTARCLFAVMLGGHLLAAGLSAQDPTQAGWHAADVASERTMTRGDWVRLIDERLAELRISSASLQAQAGFDPVLVNQGEMAFNRACTTCHDAARSLDKQKDYAGWLATVRRMAGKDDADIASADEVPIATYLASLNPAATSSADASSTGGPSTAFQQAAIYGTISPLWRGSSGEHELENAGFFVDAWVGVEWQTGGPLSARVTACTSCHSDQNFSGGFTLELVEASATLDLHKMLHPCEPGGCDPMLEASIKAGRFVVPFGAFNSMSHPGRYRTVTNPLMFNMGRRVGSTGPLQPVLPMPYSDEGINLHLDLAITCDWNATLDLYGVNGLQAPFQPADIFNASRRYVDNNREPAFGGRVTVGTRAFRWGGSLMTGNLADDDRPAVPYKVGGVDFTWRHNDALRFYGEYAIREDTLADDYVYGIVTELEARILPKVGLLARYDTLEHRYSSPGNASLDRFTYGLNVALPAGSWLMINHEHWMFEGSDDDVVGVRYTATF